MAYKNQSSILGWQISNGKSYNYRSFEVLMKILVFKVGREILSILKKALYIVCPHTVGPIRTKQFLICHLKLILDLIRKARVSRESLES